MDIIFRSESGYKPLDKLNDLLYTNSKGRFELRRTNDLSKWYMLDYDESGRNRIIRNYKEINDILECMHINVTNIFKAVKIEWEEVE